MTLLVVQNGLWCISGLIWEETQVGISKNLVDEAKGTWPSTTDGTNQIFPHPKPLPMLIRQFHTLTELKISNYNLHSFWDLRRLVVSPPLLSTLELLNVKWVSPFGPDKCQKFPSLLTTAPMLSKVLIRRSIIAVTGKGSFMVCRCGSRDNCHTEIISRDKFRLGFFCLSNY